MQDKKGPFPRNAHFHSRRPPWWPENEPWPPARPHWRRMRGRFVRRFGCRIGLVNLLTIATVVTVILLLARGFGWLKVPPSFWWFIPGGILFFFMGMVALILTGRSLRRLSAPLGDLVDAAGRITQGDFSARVPERGSSEMRSLVRSFNEMAERLKLTEEQRRSLMADISHEFRTPITVIQGNLEGMLDGVYPPDETRLKMVLEETQILSRLVDDLRTLALAESGALQLKKEPTDLAVLIGETVSAFRAQADSDGIALEIHTGRDVPPVNVDPERIRQVLTNLLANSLRYTPRGEVVKVTSSVGNGGQVLVAVEDNGAGISPEVLPFIFQRFNKSRDSSGTGLGLPIARHLVEAHGGSITAESHPGQGTVIRFTLPIFEPA